MLKKLFITVGTFDGLDERDYYLITKMQKLAAGTGQELIIVRNSWQHWNLYKQMPYQTIRARLDGVRFFSRHAVSDMGTFNNEVKTFQKILKMIKAENVIYVAYADERNIPCRDECRKRNIPIKFITYGTVKPTK